MYRGQRCCIPLRELPTYYGDPQKDLWYEGEVECGEDGLYKEPIKPLGFGRYIKKVDFGQGPRVTQTLSLTINDFTIIQQEDHLSFNRDHRLDRQYKEVEGNILPETDWADEHLVSEFYFYDGKFGFVEFWCDATSRCEIRNEKIPA